MRLTSSLTVAGVALAVAGTAVAADYAGSHDVRDKGNAEVHVPQGDASPGVADAPATPQVPDRPCVRDALPTLPPGLDARLVNAARQNPASLQRPESEQLSRQAAVEKAKAMSMDGSASAAAAVEVPFSVGGSWLGDAGNPLVANDRCTWVVTVVAPFQQRSVPPGVTPRTFDRFTVLFDLASGQYLGVGAGPGTPDVLTGAHLG